MTPEWVLLLSCAGLGLGVAYAWWFAVRPTILQADLQAIRARLDTAMRAAGRTDDARYLALRESITYTIARAADPWSYGAEREASEVVVGQIESFLGAALAQVDGGEGGGGAST